MKLKKIIPVIAIMISLAACDYRPLYAPSTPVTKELAQVRILPIADRPGQKLRNLLIDRIYHDGVPEKPTYNLQITLTESKFNLDIDRTDTANRAQLTMRAQADLIDTRDGSIAWSKNNRVIQSYNVLISPFGSLINENDARDRALDQLADDITGQLAIYFDHADDKQAPVATP